MSPCAPGLNKFVHSGDQLAFCERMRLARKQAGLTQSELAEKLGKPQSFVAKYEIGERRLDILEFLAVTGAIGTDPIRLLRALLKKIG